MISITRGARRVATRSLSGSETEAMTAIWRPHPLDEGHPPTWASEWGDDEYGVSAGFTVGEASQRLRWIPPGSFRMGFGPIHQVTLTCGFWLGDVPCTQALWKAVMGDNPSYLPTPDRRVESVSWEDCRGFFEKLNERVPGFEARFPTEAEWEHACRAGTETATMPAIPRFWVSTMHLSSTTSRGMVATAAISMILRRASTRVMTRCSIPVARVGTRRVGLKRPNSWGLYDMLGNVWEWCRDAYAVYPAEQQTDPVREEGDQRVAPRRLLERPGAARALGVPQQGLARQSPSLPGISSCPRSGRARGRSPSSARGGVRPGTGRRHRGAPSVRRHQLLVGSSQLEL